MDKKREKVWQECLALWKKLSETPDLERTEVGWVHPLKHKTLE